MRYRVVQLRDLGRNHVCALFRRSQGNTMERVRAEAASMERGTVRSTFFRWLPAGVWFDYLPGVSRLDPVIVEVRQSPRHSL